MTDFYLVMGAIVAPLVALVILWSKRRVSIDARTLRMVPAGAAVISLLLSAIATSLPTLSWMAMVVFSAISVMTFVAIPKRDLNARHQLDGLWILAGSMAAYGTGNLLVLLAGWIATLVPGWRKPAPDSAWIFPRILTFAGTTALVAALGLMMTHAAEAGATNPMALTSLRDLSAIDNTLILSLLVFAALTRKGVVPFHVPILSSCEQGSITTTMLFLNSHLGAYLLARVAMPLLPVASHGALVPLADLALLSAAFTAVMALTEKNPRRLLGLLTISQFSFLLAGIESDSIAGINGALSYWVLLSVSTCGLFLVLRSLEVRLATQLSLDQYHGLATRAPRLAAFFLISAMALVGMPGTIGFASEDLLFHGTLESHPELGLILPLATALNAITLFRMFSHLFFGKRLIHVPPLEDALPRERWALTAAVVILAVFGLRPDLLLSVTRVATAAIVP